jgi:hypothetical protein
MDVKFNEKCAAHLASGFPIMGGLNRSHYERTGESKQQPQTFIPWELIQPHDSQAKENHGGQDLIRLCQRGGLSRCEAVAVLCDRKWSPMEDDEADSELKRIVEEYNIK